MKIAILTALCGSVSPLPEPTVVFEDVDYIAFVDREHRGVDTWKQKKALDFTLDPAYKGRRNAKIYKVAPHLFLPDYDYWIWVDPTHDVVVHPKQIFTDHLQDKEIGLWRHPIRNCIYQEATTLLELKWDHPHLITSQMEHYKKEGYPEDNGLIEAPVLIRKNTSRIQTMNLRWWEQICRYSSRDQLSLPYALWKSKIDPLLLPGKLSGGSPANTNPLIPQLRPSYFSHKSNP